MAGVDEVLDNIESLPALSTSVVSITSMLSSGKAHLGEIEEVARHDEALSMTILRFANSARYGRPGRVFDLRQSIVRLGSKMLMKIVLEQNVHDFFGDAGDAYGLQRGELWRGAVGGACAAEELAETHGFGDADLCFLCGMLRDVGKLALAMHHGSGYMELVSKHQEPGRTFVECERAAFETDHAEVGAELAVRWGIPRRIADAIRYHHDPPAEAPDHDDLFDLVHAADIICLWAGLAIGHDGLQYKLAPHVRKGLGLDRREADREIVLTWGRLRELEELMGVSSLIGEKA